jgi:hypothetical protein
MTTPEFWETYIGRDLAVPADEDKAIDSSSFRAPTRSLVCEDPGDEQSSLTCFHLDNKGLKVTESLFASSFSYREH